MGGTAGGSIGEPFNMPMTAHFIGGCAIGTSPESGVVDPYQRVYGYPGLHVADGSAISANLGVNPSLTITAQAERAMALWPNKGEPDPRPAVGVGVRAGGAGRPAAPRRPRRRSRGPAAADRQRQLGAVGFPGRPGKLGAGGQCFARKPSGLPASPARFVGTTLHGRPGPLGRTRPPAHHQAPGVVAVSHQ